MNEKRDFKLFENPYVTPDEKRRWECLVAQVKELAKDPYELVFETDTMIYFREIEDLISYLLQNPHHHRFRIPAWRFYCREDRKLDHNRLYYEIRVVKGEGTLSLVAGDATDYSGHGSGDRDLAEFFIGEFLRLQIEERPLSCLFDELVEELTSS